MVGYVLLKQKNCLFFETKRLGVWNVFCFRGWWWLYVSYNLNVWCMAARFFALTDKLSSLVGLAMVVRPFFWTETPTTGFFRTGCMCLLNHISMTRRRTVLQLFFSWTYPCSTHDWCYNLMVLCSRHVVKWCYSFLYIDCFTTNRISSGYAWRFFFSHVCYVFSHFGCPEIGTRQKRMIPQKLGPNILGQSLDQIFFWVGSLWLIYHDTTGWWVPLSKGLSFSMHNWLGMSTISTQQISEMKRTISFKICCFFFWWTIYVPCGTRITSFSTRSFDLPK